MGDTVELADLRPHDLRVERIDVTPGASVEAWLVEASHGQPGFVLAHAFDGIVWGVSRTATVRTAPRRHGSPWAALRWETLLDLRWFAAAAELRIWRDPDGQLQARRVAELPGDRFVGSVDREYRLLGNSEMELADGFEVRASPRGERQGVPRGAAWLRVRHSFEADPRSGLVREAEHRWLGLLDDHHQPIEVAP